MVSVWSIAVLLVGSVDYILGQSATSVLRPRREESRRCDMGAPGLRWKEVAGAGAVFHIARHDSSQVLSRTHTHDFAELFWVESGTALHKAPTGTARVAGGDLVLV